MKLETTSHIDIDVAIEIINAMIADAYIYINEVDYNLENAVVSHDNLAGSEHQNSHYENKLQEVAQYRSEINQIYDSVNISNLLLKVETEYAPFLKQKHNKREKAIF